MTTPQTLQASAAAATSTPATRAHDRAKIQELAAEFESLLLVNVLRDMRTSGRWSETDQTQTFGAETFDQTLDVELARYLSKAGGLGLADHLLQAFNRLSGATEAAGTVPSSIGETLANPPAFPTQAPDVFISARDAAAEVTSPYGWRRDPFTGQAGFHRGVDLRARDGEGVVSTAAGRVVFSGTEGGYGLAVVVEHANGVRTRYAHLSNALVEPGDVVAAGQQIGQVGRSGRATGPHLHYEVLVGGRAVDPLER